MVLSPRYLHAIMHSLRCQGESINFSFSVIEYCYHPERNEIVPSNRKIFTLRLTDEDYAKIRVVSEANNRSMSNQIEHLVRQHIAEFEKKNGPIKI